MTKLGTIDDDPSHQLLRLQQELVEKTFHLRGDVIRVLNLLLVGDPVREEQTENGHEVLTWRLGDPALTLTWYPYSRTWEIQEGHKKPRGKVFSYEVLRFLVRKLHLNNRNVEETDLLRHVNSLLGNPLDNLTVLEQPLTKFTPDCPVRDEAQLVGVMPADWADSKLSKDNFTRWVMDYRGHPPSHFFEVRDMLGQLWWVKVRYELPEVNAKKLRTVYWSSARGWVAGRFGGLDVETPRQGCPLYREHLLAAAEHQDKVVVVVEGELKAEVAQAKFDAYEPTRGRVFVVSLTHGAMRGRLGIHSFRCLTKRHVLLLPDQDKEGYDAMEHVQELLEDLPRALRPRSVRQVELPPELPMDHHDVGDPDPPLFPQLYEQAVTRALAVPEEIAEVNRDFARVYAGDTNFVVCFKNPNDVPGRELPLPIDDENFLKLLETRPPILPVGRNAFPVPLARYWLQHPDHRSYWGTTFYPTPLERDPPARYEQTLGRRYNRWTGFAVTTQPGDWSLIDEFFTVMAGHDPHVKEYLLDWCAHIFQQPHHLPKVALVFRGTEGVGKGTFVNLLRALIGPRHAVDITNPERTLKGTFNKALKERLLISFPEITKKIGGEQLDQIKILIDNDTLQIREMQRDEYVEPNYARVVIASNEKDPLRYEHGSRRRLLFIEPGDDWVREKVDGRQKIVWFNRLLRLGEADHHPEDHLTLRAFAHHLAHERDLANFSPLVKPFSAEQEHQAELAVGSHMEWAWWADVLENGGLDVGCGHRVWGRDGSAKLFTFAYRTFLQRQHARYDTVFEKRHGPLVNRDLLSSSTVPLVKLPKAYYHRHDIYEELAAVPHFNVEAIYPDPDARVEPVQLPSLDVCAEIFASLTATRKIDVPPPEERLRHVRRPRDLGPRGHPINDELPF